MRSEKEIRERLECLKSDIRHFVNKPVTTHSSNLLEEIGTLEWVLFDRQRLSTSVEIPSYNEETRESYVDQAIIDLTNTRDFDFKWLVEETKKRNGWKIMTKSRRNMLFRNAYYLGRNGVLPPKRPSWTDLIPRVKNAGLTTNFKIIKKKES